MASKSLRHVIRKPVKRKELRRINLQTLGGDLRGGIIRNTALIERGLERHIRSRLRKKIPHDDYNALFGPTGALGTLASKIRIAYYLGIIGPMARNDLSAINDIRNVFAHSPFDVRLSNKYLKERALGIRLFRTAAASGFPEIPGWEKVTPAMHLIRAVALYGAILCHDIPKRVYVETKHHTWFGIKGHMLAT